MGDTCYSDEKQVFENLFSKCLQLSIITVNKNTASCLHLVNILYCVTHNLYLPIQFLLEFGIYKCALLIISYTVLV